MQHFKKRCEKCSGQDFYVLCQTDHKSQPWVLGAKEKYFSPKWEPSMIFNSLTNKHDLCSLNARVQISYCLSPLSYEGAIGMSDGTLWSSKLSLLVVTLPSTDVLTIRRCKAIKMQIVYIQNRCFWKLSHIVAKALQSFLIGFHSKEAKSLAHGTHCVLLLVWERREKREEGRGEKKGGLCVVCSFACFLWCQA